MSYDRRAKTDDVDEVGATELFDYAMNESSLYRMRQQIEKNLLAKAEKGQYDSHRAPQAWAYWIEAAAKAYHKEFGDSGSWSELFPRPTRMEAAQYMSQHFEAEMKAQGKALKSAGVRIANTQVLVTELRRVLAMTEAPNPSREILAAELHALSSRVL